MHDSPFSGIRQTLFEQLGELLELPEELGELGIQLAEEVRKKRGVYEIGFGTQSCRLLSSKPDGMYWSLNI